MAPTVTSGAGRTRRRWPAVLVLLLLVVPILEVVVIISVGRVIGGWPTFGLLLVESALGAWLVRREGSRTWQALSQALTTGRMPSRQLADAALVLVGGTQQYEELERRCGREKKKNQIVLAMCV